MKHHSCRAFTFIVYNLLLLVICVEINADKGKSSTSTSAASSFDLTLARLRNKALKISWANKETAAEAEATADLDKRPFRIRLFRLKSDRPEFEAEIASTRGFFLLKSNKRPSSSSSEIVDEEEQEEYRIEVEKAESIVLNETMTVLRGDDAEGGQEGASSPASVAGLEGSVTTSVEDYMYYDNDYSDEFIPPSEYEVRVEEIAIVTLILVIWVGAILLFVHRWGKIRMLVPHQPRYAYTQAQQQAVAAAGAVGAAGSTLAAAETSVTGPSVGVRVHSRSNLTVYDAPLPIPQANFGSSMQLYQQRRAKYATRSAGTTFSSCEKASLYGAAAAGNKPSQQNFWHNDGGHVATAAAAASNNSRNNSLRSSMGGGGGDFYYETHNHHQRPAIPRSSRLLYPQRQQLSTRSDDDCNEDESAQKRDRRTQSAIDLRLLIPAEPKQQQQRQQQQKHLNLALLPVADLNSTAAASVVITPCSSPSRKLSPRDELDDDSPLLPTMTSVYLRHISEEPSMMSTTGSATSKRSFAFPPEAQNMKSGGDSKEKQNAVSGGDKKATQV